MNSDIELGSAELDLVAACCSACFAGETRPLAVPSKPIHWSHFLRLARRHRVQGLCFKALSRTGIAIPEDVCQELKADHHALIESNLRSLSLAVQVRDRFRAEAIPVQFLKGHSISRIAYDDPFVKMNADLDILAAPTDLDRATLALKDLGLEQVWPPSWKSLRAWHGEAKESVWTSSEGVLLDLHTRLADNPRLLGMVDVAADADEVRVHDDLSLPTLGERLVLPYLAVHGASSAWFRLKWLSDFAAVVANSSASELQQAYEMSKKHGAGRAFQLALALSQDVFGSELPQGLQRTRSGPNIVTSENLLSSPDAVHRGAN